MLKELLNVMITVTISWAVTLATVPDLVIDSTVMVSLVKVYYSYIVIIVPILSLDYAFFQ